MYMVNNTSDFLKENVSNVNMTVKQIGSVETCGHDLPFETAMF